MQEISWTIDSWQEWLAFFSGFFLFFTSIMYLARIKKYVHKEMEFHEPYVFVSKTPNQYHKGCYKALEELWMKFFK